MFTPGTFIATESGQRPVETLRRGDRVVTRNNGLKRIAWLGRRDLGYYDLESEHDLRPVLIKAGALGKGRPERDMLVSRSHRFVSEGDTLSAAHALVDYHRIVPAPTLGVSYVHMLFNSHEVILANGAWAESFHPDDAGMKTTAPEQRREILLMFPQVATMGAARLRVSSETSTGERSRFET